MALNRLIEHLLQNFQSNYIKKTSTAIFSIIQHNILGRNHTQVLFTLKHSSKFGKQPLGFSPCLGNEK